MLIRSSIAPSLETPLGNDNRILYALKMFTGCIAVKLSLLRFHGFALQKIKNNIADEVLLKL